MIYLQTLLSVSFSLVAIKSITVGSAFSFYLWIKHGKKYTDWYFGYYSKIEYPGESK